MIEKGILLPFSSKHIDVSVFRRNMGKENFMMNKPNHICKYTKCTNGKDGGRKHYFACDYCDRTQVWRSVACCPEHYDLYIKEVLAARGQSVPIDILPDRTDKTKEEVRELPERALKHIAADLECRACIGAEADPVASFL